MVTGGPPGWRLETYDSLASTSDLCIGRAEAGEAAGLAVLAQRQTQGRGSRGRSWTGQAGNLALSVLLRPKGDLRQLGLWPFLAGLSLHQALGGAGLRLKWPNDVLLGNAKLAGILIERGTGAGADWLVIGFGANLVDAPALPDRETACLAELGPAPDALAVAERLLDALDGWQSLWRRDGFEAIRAAWLDRAHPVGTVLAVDLQGIRRSGVFAGLAPDGALLLSVDGRQERIDTGEILLPCHAEGPTACG